METWDITTRDLAQLAIVDTWNGDPHEFAGKDLFAWMDVADVADDEHDHNVINRAATERRFTDAAAEKLGLGDTWSDPETFRQIVTPDHPAAGSDAVFIRRIGTDA